MPMPTRKGGSVQLLSERTSLPDAMIKVLETLKENETSYTVNRLVSETKLHRRTVEKVLGLLEQLQEYFKQTRLDVEQLNRIKIVRMQREVGLASLPERTQRLIVKSVYLPEPTKEQRVNAYAFLHNATSRGKSIELEQSDTVNTLVKQGQLLEQDGKFYLSDEGVTVAKGTLDLFPELIEFERKI